MSNEAIILELGPNGGAPQRFTVADATGITKGTLLKLSGDCTAQASSSTDVFAGIAAADKEASDGATSIAAYTEGIFDLTCVSDGTGVSLGNMVVLSGANLIRPALEADTVLGKIVGKALEAGSSGEVIRVDIGAKG